MIGATRASASTRTSGVSWPPPRRSSGMVPPRSGTGCFPSAASSSSYGLMQLNATYFKNPDGTPILDPEKNIDTGTAVIAEQLARRPSVELALAGYNAGTGRSDSDLQNRIAGNVNGVGAYVSSVLTYRDWFIAQEEGGGIEPAPDWGEDDADLKLVASIVVFGMLAFVLLRR